jgi:iron complex outermembrane receptor protein
MSLIGRHLLWIASVFIGVSGSAPRAQADEGSSSPVEGDLGSGLNLEQLLNLTVVTASGGVEEERSLAPASVVVFTRDDIARQGWRSLTEILQNTPGLDVVDDEVMPSVGVRAITGGIRATTRILKVMIDGMAVSFRPDLAAFIGPEFIPIEVVDRVEIAKGPLSAIYGANAFLAVVNIITIRAPDAPRAGVNLRANPLSLSGSPVTAPNRYGVSGFITETSGALEIVAAFSLDHVDRSGLRITHTVPNQDPTLPRYAPFFVSASQDDVAAPRSGFLALRLPLNRWGSIALKGGVQQLDSKAEFQLSSVLTHRSRIAIDNYWSQAHYEKAWSERLRLVATLGYSTGAPTRDEILYLTNNYLSSFTPRFKYQAYDAGFQLVYTPARRISLVMGADGSYEPQRTLYYTQTFHSTQGTNMPGDSVDLIGGSDRRDVVLTNAGAYAQLSAVPFGRLPTLHVTVSGRLDVPSLFPVQYSWRTAVAYRVNPGLTLKIFAGRAFQVPSAVLLYGHPGFGATNNVLGNGLLRPQVVNSIEAAASASPSRWLMLESNVFYQQIQDRIEFAQAGADFIARNHGTGSNLGLEMTARALFYRLRPYASAAAQRTLLAGSLDTPPPSMYPNYWFRGGVEADFPELRLRMAAQVRWVGARTASQSNVLLTNNRPYELPSFAQVDLTVSSLAFRPLRAGPEVNLALRAQNLLDQRHPVPGFGGMDLPSPGRVIMLDVGYAH